MTAISLSGVSFGYGSTTVLEDVSLDVEGGAFLGLVGPNGSGKSTLLRLVLGLERPDTGTVELFGRPAHRADAAGRVGYVAQGAAHAGDSMPITVGEVVRMGRYPHVGRGRFGAEDRERVRAAIEAVDIGDLTDRLLGQLSGGQRQRALIARALAADAELLVLDEPVVGLDADAREAFYALLGSLHESGITVLLVEHDIGVVTAHASRVACLNRRLHFHGEPDDLGTDTLAEAYGANQRLLSHDHP